MRRTEQIFGEHLKRNTYKMSACKLSTFTALLLVLVATLSTTTSAEYVRACYFTNWAPYREGKGKYEPERYIPGMCTHMLFAFGWMDKKFSVSALDPADLSYSNGTKGMYERMNNLKKKDPNLKTLLSVGGWSFGTTSFTAMSKVPDHRNKFIQTAMKFLTEHKFDGMDLDWEYPKGAKQQYITLIKELRRQFDAHKPRLLLTAAVSASTSMVDEAYDVPEMAPAFDFVLLMSYDFHGSWEPNTGLNSPLFHGPKDKLNEKYLNTAGAAGYWHKLGMPKGKLLIGIAAYGRGWTLLDSKEHSIRSATKGTSEMLPFTQKGGMGAYFELCALEKDGATKVFSEEHGSPYLFKGDQWFGYDDPKSVEKKMKWLKKEGYGGAFMWSLGLDDFRGDCGHGKYPLLSVIETELKTPPTTSTQTPTTTTVPTTESAAWKCKGQFGLFRDPDDCAAFYQCDHWRAHHHKCHPGSVFNPTYNVCDWPRNVDCYEYDEYEYDDDDY